MTSGKRFMKTYLKSSGVKTILAQSCRCSMMSSTSPAKNERRTTSDQTVKHTVEVNFPLKVRVVEHLHGDFFLAMVKSLEFWVIDGDVLFNLLGRKNDLLVLAFPVHGRDRPVHDSDGNTEDDDKKDVGFESATVDKGRDAFQDVRDA